MAELWFYYTCVCPANLLRLYILFLFMLSYNDLRFVSFFRGLENLDVCNSIKEGGRVTCSLMGST